MGFRDRFYTLATARAILSWRIALGLAAGIVSSVVGAPVLVAIGAGAAVYAASIAAAMPKPAKRPAIDAFALSEPWRQFVESARRSRQKLRDTVDSASDGPLRDRLRAIADQLDHGLDEAWAVAKRGDEIDDAVRRLDPTALRSRFGTLQRQAAEAPSPDIDGAIASVEGQLASADRLKAQSDETALKLRLTQTKLDELVARAAEVQVGAADTDTYASEVDDLVIQLEALHQAVEETRPS